MVVKNGLVIHADKVEKKIKIFEKAVDLTKLILNPIRIERIFLAIDAHSEAIAINENALQISRNLALKYQAEVYVVCIAPTTEELKISKKLVRKAITLLESENITVTGSCAYGRPSEHILELSNQFNPSLIIMPTPYGERSETFNIESLGTSVDIILRKSPFPTLLVRKPIFPPNEIVKSILLIINSLKTIQAENNSKIMILSITEKETMEKVEEITESLLDFEIDKDIVERLHRWEIRALTNGIVSEAETKGIEIEKKHRIGDRIRLTLEEAKQNHTIIILNTIIERDNILENEVENICRLSRIPILIIKN
jgi:nucleotide-binding universal stress UspA family protein